MSKIRILPEILSNKIAAGEVVERPSSVVKELVENAIDADSTKIIIEVEQGGRSLIRISDNGTGMNHDDALLALDRYATSKISEERDLFSINTLGFRGEALPSIASVSRFTIVTRDETALSGTQIFVEGGKIKKVSEIGAPVGTMIVVENLFYNTPARRKFLKAINTEMGHIADIIASIALAWPGIHFTLIHNGRVVKRWALVSDPFDRVVDALGKPLRKDLYKISFTDDDISLSGWVSSPSVTRSTSKGLYIYVNGRYIRDRAIGHALLEGYRGRLMKGRFPVAVLFINIPFDQLDVNVHPTKNEVRFAQQKKVYETIKTNVSDIWQAFNQPRWPTLKEARQQKLRISPPDSIYQCPEENTCLRKSNRKGYFKQSESIQDKPYIAEPGSRYSRTEAGVPLSIGNGDTAQQKTLWEKKFFGDLKLIGQLHDTYILCESEEGLVLIDQHAAHERILFELLKNRSSVSSQPAQQLLIPESIETGYNQAPILEKLMPSLKDFGLEIEPFGGNTFVIKSVPNLLAERDIKPLIMEIVEKMEEIGFDRGLENAINHCLIVMACHGAIRAHQSLTDQQMEALLNQLDECDNPFHCPHGRPTWIKWTIRELEKSFKRIV